MPESNNLRFPDLSALVGHHASLAQLHKGRAAEDVVVDRMPISPALTTATPCLRWDASSRDRFRRPRSESRRASSDRAPLTSPVFPAAGRAISSLARQSAPRRSVLDAFPVNLESVIAESCRRASAISRTSTADGCPVHQSADANRRAYHGSSDYRSAHNRPPCRSTRNASNTNGG